MSSTLYRKIGRQQEGFSESPPPKHRHHEGDTLLFAPKDWAVAQVRSGGPVRNSAARRDASDQRIETVREGSDFSAGLRSVEPLIRVASRRTGLKSQIESGSSSIGRRTLRAAAACFIAALIRAGGSSAWLSHGEGAKEIFRNWTPSRDALSSMSTTKYPSAPVPAMAATSPEFVRQLEAMPRDLAAVRSGVQQLTEKQEQMARNIAALRSAEHGTKRKGHLFICRAGRNSFRSQTRPTTIAGWTLRGITNGTAVLEGPHGTWSAMQGDTVPGVGRVKSMVRWGGRLIVATSSGLISTP